MEARIELGKRYPVKILKNGQESLLCLQYAFKPSSVDASGDGNVFIDKKEATVSLPSADGGRETFQGVALEQPNEYVMILRDGTFELKQVVTTVAQLRHCRRDETYSKFIEAPKKRKVVLPGKQSSSKRKKKSVESSDTADKGVETKLIGTVTTGGSDGTGQQR